MIRDFLDDIKNEFDLSLISGAMTLTVSPKLPNSRMNLYQDDWVLSPSLSAEQGGDKKTDIILLLFFIFTLYPMQQNLYSKKVAIFLYSFYQIDEMIEIKQMLNQSLIFKSPL